MYNEKLKTEFIEKNCNESEAALFRSLFKYSEEYEVNANTDICSMSKENLINYLDREGGSRYDSKRRVKYALIKYAEWCVNKGVPNATTIISSIDVSELGMGAIKRQTVANSQHLEMFLDHVCEPVEIGTTDCIHRAWSWLAYAGIKLSDSPGILKTDINFQKMVIEYKGKEYPIYRESIPALKACIEATEWCTIYPNSKKKFVYKPRKDGNELLICYKDTISTRRLSNNFRTKIAKAHNSNEFKLELDNELYNLDLSYSRIWISGIFYRMYESEVLGMPVDFTPLAKEIIACNEHYSGESNKINRNKRVKDVARAYKADYLKWKKAYYK